MSGRDVVVVGAGLAGLTAALRLARAGASVALVSKGLGGLQLSQGTLDVLGYSPDRVSDPFAALPTFIQQNPDHPYASTSTSTIRAAISLVTEAAGPGVLAPPAAANVQLPTGAGAVRPTLCAPPSMLAGDVVDGQRFVAVGFKHLKDFPAGLVAGNLARTRPPGGGRIEARAAWTHISPREGEYDCSALTWARALEEEEFRDRLAREVSLLVDPGETVLLPAMLGLTAHAFEDFAARLDHPVAEIPLPPPGVPGMRLAKALTDSVRAAGVRLINGASVIGARTEGSRVVALVTAQAGRDVGLRARWFVYAPGGFESGALTVDSTWRIHEPALGLPLTADDSTGLISGDFWGSEQALFRVGVRTDGGGRVLDAAGETVYDNLYAAGGILAGANRWREKSGDGIAAATGYRAAETILQECEGK